MIADVGTICKLVFVLTQNVSYVMFVTKGGNMVNLSAMTYDQWDDYRPDPYEGWVREEDVLDVDMVSLDVKKVVEELYSDSMSRERLVESLGDLLEHFNMTLPKGPLKVGRIENE